MNTTIRPIVRATYDLQKLRISVGNRVAMSFRSKLGQMPGEKLEEEESKKILKKVEEEYDLLTEGYIEEGKKITKSNFKATEIFCNYAEYELVSNYKELLLNEKHFFKTLERAIADIPIWRDWLKGVLGVGPAMAGVILSEFDINKAEHSSAFWMYCGLSVESDGRGTGRYKEHLVTRKYIDKKGEEKEKLSIKFNPFLKTKMVGVLGASFLKQNPEKCKYRKVYDDYKHRLENHPVWQERTKLHRHNAAIRYCIKIFLLDLWLKWREIEGLPVTEPYHVAKLGLRSHPV